MIPILEIFGCTIQGEGPNVGARCIFVRVKGCTYACSWCDTKETWLNHSAEATSYTDEALINELYNLSVNTMCNRVVLTGGNPCMYDFTTVIKSLKRHIKFDVETQGDLLPDWLSLVDTIVFSPKAPSSKMPDTYDNITKYISEKAKAHQTIAIKIPVFNKDDIEFARKYAKFVNNFMGIHDNNLKLYLSVGNTDVDTTDSIRDGVLTDYEALLNTINIYPEDFQNVFLLPQLHTLVWGNKSGV